jgi:carbamoyl-phosphate synthase small subunit
LLSLNNERDAVLVLADGTTFRGLGIGAEGISVGEVVFNTAITGYQEILTDASYACQIVTLTYPHIGNVGVNAQDEESNKVWAAGLVIRDLSNVESNFRSEGSLRNYLRDNNIVGIANIDTRKLTRILREKGSQNGCIMTGKIDLKLALKSAREFPGLQGMDLASIVSIKKPIKWHEPSWRLSGRCSKPDAEKFRVVAYDYGVKHNILRLLVDRFCEIILVPAHTPAADVLKLRPDGVFLSNGPGDPAPCDYAIEAIKIIIENNIPIFGICLGHQLLALASGARTKKMKFGHHGANHPVLDITENRVLITSQNHGFAVDESSMPANLKPTHRSLFDGSLQGIERTDRPAFSFQGHPEASPGPHEAASLFDQFVNLMAEYKQCDE